MGNFYLTMEETAEELRHEADKYLSVGCPDAAEMWNTFARNEGHVYFRSK